MGRKLDKKIRKAVRNNMTETWDWFAELLPELPLKRWLFLAWCILFKKDIRK